VRMYCVCVCVCDFCCFTAVAFYDSGKKPQTAAAFVRLILPHNRAHVFGVYACLPTLVLISQVAFL